MALRPLSSLWPANWEEQVTTAVRTRGYPDVLSFVTSHPQEGFHALARRLDSLAPPAMLSVLYYRDAFRVGAIRAAAIDGLVRMFQDFIPTGWKNYDEGLRPGVREINLAVSWTDELNAVDERFATFCLAVDDALWGLNPSKGWLPFGPDDLILRAAFDAGWPADTGPKQERET